MSIPARSRCFPVPAAALLLVWAIGCAGPAPAPSGDQDDPSTQPTQPPYVVATTGMIGDLAGRLLLDLGKVDTLMGPGIDPHLYKASEGDIRKLARADLVLYNGLQLEGKMGDILEKMAQGRPVIAIGNAVPKDSLQAPPAFAGQFDPHIWFDVSLWTQTIDPIVEAFVARLPTFRDMLEARATALREELIALDAWVAEEIARIPPERRVLVTAHDAFGYFGTRYGLEVVGLQGISTLSEAGLQDVERVVDLVVTRAIPAIFVESSVPRRTIEAVQAACAARGHTVAIGGELFSDAMGAPGTNEGTYLGMVRHNVETLVAALTADADAP